MFLTFLFVNVIINTNKNVKKIGDGLMSQKDMVYELLNRNNGIITAKEANSLGVTNKTLQRMNQSEEIEKISAGLYIDPSRMQDEYYLAQYRCKKGIFSHETAFYFHDLSDRTPVQLMMTIPSGYNTRLLKEKTKYKFFYSSEKLHHIGRTMVETPFGQKVYVYDKERTICDCLKKKNQLDVDLVVEALKRYLTTPGADYAKLLKYAEIFNIRELVKNYMEVLR